MRRPPSEPEGVRTYVERKERRYTLRSAISWVLPSFLLNLFFQVAQVEGDDFRIVHQVAALAGVGVASLVEDVAAVADLQAAAGVCSTMTTDTPALLTWRTRMKVSSVSIGGQACGGLVEQEDGWFHHEGAGHGHHLAFTAESWPASWFLRWPSLGKMEHT